jgi:uncharacterized paraquat-inducible protein A
LATPFGAKKRRVFRKWSCCDCNVEIEVVHRTKTAKCWDCYAKMIKEYQHEHKALKVNTNYAEPINQIE